MDMFQDVTTNRAWKRMIKEKITHDLDIMEKLINDHKDTHLENYIKLKALCKSW